MVTTNAVMNNSDPPQFLHLLPRLVDLLSSARPALKLGNLLVPLDFTETSLRSLPYAAFLARHFGCSVILLHAVHLNIVGEEKGIPLTRFLAEIKTAAERTLHEILSSVRLPRARVVVRIGDPVSAILQEITESKIDLTILPRCHRKFPMRFFTRSLIEKVAAKTASSPILAV